MYPELKENKPHGTKDYPYTQYHIFHSPKAFHIPVHWHDEVEMIYVREGELRISIEGKIYTATSGEVFLVNPGELHYMEADKIPVDYYTILFPLQFISFLSQDRIEREILLPFREGKLILQNDINQKAFMRMIEEMILELIEVNDEKKGIYELRTKTLLLRLIAEFAEEDCFHESVMRKNSYLQREMISYIQDHFEEKITLEMLADEFHLSQKYISRYFKEQFAISFMQYVGHLRMEKAKDLLRNTELSITEVAMSSGYPSVNLFIRNFKEAYQITPLQYRKSR